MLRIRVNVRFSYVTDRIANPPFLSADLLDRYFAGDCTAAEIAQIRAWVSGSSEREADLEALRQLRIAKPSASWDLDTRWAAILPHLTDEAPMVSFPEISVQRESGSEPRFEANRWTKRKSVSAHWRSIVGAFAVLLLGVFVWRGGDDSARTATPAQWSTYTTAKGKQATITLPDGSTVFLNVASQLEVPTDYDRGNRTLRLTGEAFFTVTHHTGTPFTVKAGSSTTRVLGTSFIVRRYHTDRATTVAVRDGKVTVGPTVLTAGQEAVTDDAGLPHIQPADVHRFAFVRGEVNFEDIPLIDAIPELNRWYDTDIRLGDASLASRRVIGTFESGSLTDLVSILELMFGVRVVRSGHVLTLYPRG